MPASPNDLLAHALLTDDLRAAAVRHLEVTAQELRVALEDGRTLTVPIAWFPRLAEGTPAERARWELLGDGQGIHWPDLDEDILLASLLAGRRSGESPASLARWRTALAQARASRAG